MIQMKRVVQTDETGCGLACVASVAGMTYQEVKALFIQEIFKKKKRTFWTNHKHLEQALDYLNIPSKRKRFTSWSEFDGIAIMPIGRNKRDKHFHWVVAIKQDRTISLLDPESILPFSKKVRIGRPKVSGFYIQILEKLDVKRCQTRLVR